MWSMDFGLPFRKVMVSWTILYVCGHYSWALVPLAHLRPHLHMLPPPKSSPIRSQFPFLVTLRSELSPIKHRDILVEPPRYFGFYPPF